MRLEVFRNREVIIALFAGIALVLYMALFYIDLWKPRKMKENEPDEPDARYLSVWEGIPWTIKVIVVIIVLAMAMYIIYLFVNPPVW